VTIINTIAIARDIRIEDAISHFEYPTSPKVPEISPRIEALARILGDMGKHTFNIVLESYRNLPSLGEWLQAPIFSFSKQSNLKLLRYESHCCFV